jgi:tRNA pseudouridine38-40 synthase
LNGILPRDVAVRRADEVASDFHSRFSAKSRTYVYLLWREPARSALWGRFATWESAPLNLEAMQEAASCLIGTRDFGSFANAGGDPGSTLVREVKRLEVVEIEGRSLMAVRITANAFLRSMVRNVVGMLVCVGKGDLAPSGVPAIAASGRRELNPCPTAPPQGLCLLRVEY